MSTKKKDVFSGVFLLALSCSIYLSARQIPTRLRIGVDSGFMPEVVSAVLAMLAIIIIWQGIRNNDHIVVIKNKNKSSVHAVAQSLMLIIIYGLAISHVGFIPATIIFLVAQFYILAPSDKHNPVYFVIVAVITALATNTIFTYGFGVILPSGNLW
ncbi:tripartite tricarboxylate transporter TctB family protein [Lentilitoribacter sp. EG35]|uniref:tripartite tricarboxylate transporter TctB family protein n=1 Tax=Lentilitoribacter sp. EG35 TaxID=3234192 RepID=UPI003460E2C8